MELAGSPLHYWSHFPFQVTDCLSAEPLQGRFFFFSINNLDMHSKSGLGLNSGHQICTRSEYFLDKTK